MRAVRLSFFSSARCIQARPQAAHSLHNPYVFCSRLKTPATMVRCFVPFFRVQASSHHERVFQQFCSRSRTPLQWTSCVQIFLFGAPFTNSTQATHSIIRKSRKFCLVLGNPANMKSCSHGFIRNSEIQLPSDLMTLFLFKVSDTTHFFTLCRVFFYFPHTKSVSTTGITNSMYLSWAVFCFQRFGGPAPTMFVPSAAFLDPQRIVFDSILQDPRPIRSPAILFIPTARSNAHHVTIRNVFFVFRTPYINLSAGATANACTFEFFF